MNYLIMDLEWNGAFHEKSQKFFNEIIEIGAVKVDAGFRRLGEYHALLKPVVSTKLSPIVLGLTSITDDELKTGISFSQAVEQLVDFTSDDKTVLVTWSNTDLMVLMDNFKYFYDNDTIPFMNAYVDGQQYCQKKLGLGNSQQLGLENACKLLEIPPADTEWHRALDDSRQTAAVLEKVYDAGSLQSLVKAADDDFYGRMRFKPFLINDLDHPELSKGAFRFTCERCGKALRNAQPWVFHHRAFCAELVCRQCGTRYLARVQCKRVYDGVQTKRRLTVKPAPEEKKAERTKREEEAV